MPEFTNAAMRQYSHEFIIDRRFKTATLKNIWIERPVGPRETISINTTKIELSMAEVPIKSL